MSREIQWEVKGEINEQDLWVLSSTYHDIPYFLVRYLRSAGNHLILMPLQRRF